MLNDEQKNDSDLGSKDVSYVINKQKMAIVLSALASGNRVDLTEVLEPLHPADIADIIEQLNTTDRARFIRLYDTEFYGDILSEIDEHIREEVIAELKPDILAEAVRACCSMSMTRRRRLSPRKRKMSAPCSSIWGLTRSSRMNGCCR